MVNVNILTIFWILFVFRRVTNGRCCSNYKIQLREIIITTKQTAQNKRKHNNTPTQLQSKNTKSVVDSDFRDCNREEASRQVESAPPGNDHDDDDDDDDDDGDDDNDNDNDNNDDDDNC